MILPVVWQALTRKSSKFQPIVCSPKMYTLLKLSNNDEEFKNFPGGNTPDPRFRGGQSLFLFSENIVKLQYCSNTRFKKNSWGITVGLFNRNLEFESQLLILQYLLYHYCDSRHQLCGNRYRDLSEIANADGDMKGHAKQGVTLNLKVKHEYIIVFCNNLVISDHDNVEVDNEIFSMAQIQPEIY